MRRKQIWSVAYSEANHEEKTRQLINGLGISRVVANLLVKRNMADLHMAREFLYPNLASLSDPYLIPGMAEAVTRIEKAIARQEKVVIYGDYDVDGVCSITVLKECLDLFMPKVDYYIPNRFREGYGLNVDAIRAISEMGCQLLITVDCGIASLEEIELAKKLGMDVLVTDHHQPGKALPNAVALVNPKLDPSTGNELAGVGVVFQLVRALSQTLTDIDPLKWLDVVALATVADIVPLLGDNRILVKEGMKLLDETVRPGLKALIDTSGLSRKKLEYWHIGFVLAPRLNAAGRMEEATAAVELLLASSYQEAEVLAEKLTILNTTRQAIEGDIFKEAQDEAAYRVDQGDKMLVLAKEGWHQGVLGIVASRLVEKFGKPVLLVSWDGQQGKGSARTASGFDMFEALSRCRNHLEKFGGHKQAAGVALHRSQLESLRLALNEVAASSWDENQHSQIIIDGQLEFQEITPQLVHELSLMEPFGLGNEPPIFVLRSAKILNPVGVGKLEDHLKFQVQVEMGQPIDAIGFGMADFLEQPLSTQLCDLVIKPGINTFRGQDRIQVQVFDIKKSDSLDNPHVFPYLIEGEKKHLFVRLENSIKERHREGSPVLVVYPTVRCLEKHFLGLQRIFPKRLLVPIHGCLSEAVKRRHLDGLKQGNKRIFLTTAMFLEYTIKKLEIREKLSGIVLWPEAGVINEDYDNWESFRLDKPEPNLVMAPDMLSESVCSCRRVIYTNRRKTLRRMFRQGDGVEVGLKDTVQRMRVREKFSSQELGSLFWDGTFGGALPPIMTDQMILGDSPFGWYEIDNLLAQVIDELPEIILNFSEEDLNWNRQYLDYLYPERDFLVSLYEKLRARSGRVRLPFATNINRDKIKSNRYLAFRSGLKILYELGLYQLVRRNDYYEIHTVSNDNNLDLRASPYYREGIQEKKVFNEWIAKLPK